LGMVEPVELTRAGGVEPGRAAGDRRLGEPLKTRLETEN